MLKAAFAAALALCAASSAYAKTPQGAYTISFFVDPGSSGGSQICLSLTAAKGIAGFKESGTFVDTDGDSIAGQYVVDGKILHLVMLTTGFGDNVDVIGPLKGTSASGNFDDFFTGYNGGDNTILDSGTFTLVPGCSDGDARRHPQHSVTR